MLVAGLALFAGLGPGSARAGGQLEEPLADAVRTALSSAVSNGRPPRPGFNNIEERLAYLRWLGAMSQRLLRRNAEHLTRVEFLETVWYESRRAGLDSSLVLGLIEVESGFRKFAVSVAGARGYMQVMPFWARSIGDGDASRLFHLHVAPRTRYGNGELAKTAFDLDQTQHERAVQACAAALVPDRLEELDAREVLGVAP